MLSQESLLRELKFALRDRVVLISLVGIALLSLYSVMTGLSESESERIMIEQTKAMVAQDRQYNLAQQSDAGGAAYYAFHFTYDPPSSLGFIARGVRDDLPWRHRLRMLAIEGQIYEADVGNPQLSKIGKLDFAFVAAFLLPLLSILLLYDLRAVEVRSNRWVLLSVMAGNAHRLLLWRAILRTCLLYLALILPLLLVVTLYSSNSIGILVVMAAIALNCLFWCFLCVLIFTRIESGPTTAAVLLACWFVVAIAIPVAGKHAVEHLISVPKGGNLLLSQREAVNDAWDLPKDATMRPFLERHPKWRDTPAIEKPFEWKWYYAFHQVGDQTVESYSKTLRSNIARRDKAMSVVSLASPSLLTDRLISQVAGTDVVSFQRYDACVRRFHHQLREFHYPMLFGNVEYSSEHMNQLPDFKPCDDSTVHANG